MTEHVLNWSRVVREATRWRDDQQLWCLLRKVWTSGLHRVVDLHPSGDKSWAKGIHKVLFLDTPSEEGWRLLVGDVNVVRGPEGLVWTKGFYAYIQAPDTLSAFEALPKTKDRRVKPIALPTWSQLIKRRENMWSVLRMWAAQMDVSESTKKQYVDRMASLLAFFEGTPLENIYAHNVEYALRSAPRSLLNTQKRFAEDLLDSMGVAGREF